MKRIIIRSFVLALCALLLPLLPAAAQTAQSAPQDVTVVAGAQNVNDVDARGAARFEEFRDVPDGFVFDFLRAKLNPENAKYDLTFTAIDGGQKDQRLYLNFWLPGTLKINSSYTESLRTYSTGSTTLFSGIGTGNLTIPEPFRAGAEAAAPNPAAPFASPDLVNFMFAAVAGGTKFNLATDRRNLDAGLEYAIAPNLTLSLSGRDEKRGGTVPFSFGTYIRRQALSGTPGTGAGQFWRETIEARGVELIQPLDYDTREFGATLTWAKNGHSASAGVFASNFRNDTTALYFDNPFEATPGRASATIFDPNAEQEPASPNGNNSLRGLTARSVMALAPNNDYTRAFATVSLKLPHASRVNATVARGTFEQDDAFLPYAENPLVVYSGVAGQPGVVYAKDAPLPQSSLDGKMVTTQADVRFTSHILAALDVRAGLRYYDLDDQRPSILFPGFASSGDAYFRPGIGQKDASGKRILFNEVGGYTRERFSAGVAYRIGRVALDGELARTEMDYDARQVDKTTDDMLRASVRVPAGEGSFSASYQRSQRDFSGDYHVGLETSGIRAYDVWKRDRDEFGFEYETAFGENITANAGATFWKEDYPGAVKGFTYPYGRQDAKSSSIFAGTNVTVGTITFGATAGIDRYEVNNLQVTKTSLATDYNPIDRWTRGSKDRVFWLGLDALVPVATKGRWETAVDFQRFHGDWNTVSLGTPDVNSAVTYGYPSFKDRTVSARTSFLWDITQHIGVEVRYLYEPYRLDDFTVDIMQPYMQGVFKETRSNPADIGDMNVSRFLFLDSRYGDYDAQVASLLVHVGF